MLYTAGNLGGCSRCSFLRRCCPNNKRGTVYLTVGDIWQAEGLRQGLSVVLWTIGHALLVPITILGAMTGCRWPYSRCRYSEHDYLSRGLCAGRKHLMHAGVNEMPAVPYPLPPGRMGGGGYTGLPGAWHGMAWHDIDAPELRWVCPLMCSTPGRTRWCVCGLPRGGGATIHEIPLGVRERLPFHRPHTVRHWGQRHYTDSYMLRTRNHHGEMKTNKQTKQNKEKCIGKNT